MEFSTKKLNAIEKVKKDRWALSNLKQFRKDRDVSIEALKAHGGSVYSQVDESLKKDKEIILLGLTGLSYYNLTDRELAQDEEIQKVYVEALQRAFDDNLIKALESIENDNRDFIKFERETIDKFWNHSISLENLYQWFVDNDLKDRLPDPNEFKIQKLKNELKSAKVEIEKAKRDIESYFKINEFEFGRSQWSVKSSYKSLTKSYDSFISKKESFESDLKEIENSDTKDLNFLIDLEELDLSNSDINSLPKDMKLMWGLKSVDISNTAIKEIDVEFHGYTKPSFNISKTALSITPQLQEKIFVSDFDIDTEIDPSLLKRYDFTTKQFITKESDPIKKIELAQKYEIDRVKIDPETLTDKFFELDLSGIKLIDLYSSYKPVDEVTAKKLDKLSPETVYAYETTWGSLKERFKSELDQDEFKEVMKNLDEVYREDAPDSERMVIISYRDFSCGYLEIECSDEKASIIANGVIYSEDEALVVLNSDESWGVTVAIYSETTVNAGTHEWSYEYTDTNDGALEQYRANCSAELEDISLEDAILYKLNEKDGEEIVEEYELEVDREDEGVYY